MVFTIRPTMMPRSIPMGRQGYTNGIAAPPSYRQRGVALDVKPASPETTMDNPPGAGPASIFAPQQTPLSQLNRKTTLEDVQSFYQQYLGRNAILGEEVGGAAEGSDPGHGTTGRIGNDFTAVLNQVRGSQEFKNRVSSGVRPESKNPFTGKVAGPTETIKYARGGMINEEVHGTGKSGKKYVIGEAGPERVTPVSTIGGGVDTPRPRVTRYPKAMAEGVAHSSYARVGDYAIPKDSSAALMRQRMATDKLADFKTTIDFPPMRRAS